jgi:hypothetical protein
VSNRDVDDVRTERVQHGAHARHECVEPIDRHEVFRKHIRGRGAHRRLELGRVITGFVVSAGHRICGGRRHRNRALMTGDRRRDLGGRRRRDRLADSDRIQPGHVIDDQGVAFAGRRRPKNRQHFDGEGKNEQERGRRKAARDKSERANRQARIS